MVKKKENSSQFTLKFYCKDIRRIKLGFSKRSTSETIAYKDIFDTLQSLVFVEYQTSLFAFAFKGESGMNNLWQIYDFEEEYKRQGLHLSPPSQSPGFHHSSKWRVTTINLD